MTRELDRIKADDAEKQGRLDELINSGQELMQTREKLDIAAEKVRRWEFKANAFKWAAPY